jgi:hypothetical protein
MNDDVEETNVLSTAASAKTSSSSSNNFKLHIDSNLIKPSLSSLPDELKDLGVCAYDENEFEKGVLFQFDLQLAEYELDEAKKKLKNTSQNKHIDIDESTSSSSNSETNHKRKSDQFDPETVNYKEKKARLECTLVKYNKYLNSQDDSQSAQTASKNDEMVIEELIKTGEMTPFGTVIDFDKGCSKTNESQPKQTATIGKPKSAKLNSKPNVTEFDSFLLDFDKKAPSSNKSNKTTTKKPKIYEFNETARKLEMLDSKQSSEAQKMDTNKDQAKLNKNNSISSSYIETKLTDFDKFLSDFDNKPKTSKQAQQTSKNETLKKSVSSTNTKMDLVTSKKALITPEPKKAAPKIAKTSASSSCNKKSITPVSESKKSNKKEESKIDKISFMNLIDGDDDDDDNEVPPKRTNNKANKKLVLTESENSKSNDGEGDDYDKNDPDFELLDAVSETSSVEYITEDEESGDGESKKRKKNLKRTCMDDGDDEVYSRRMKTLEKNEKLYDEMNDVDDEDYSMTDESENSNETKPTKMNNQKHVDLDGGLKVPENIWERLYKFQKTGLKWLWELHLQRCGGILGDEVNKI